MLHPVFVALRNWCKIIKGTILGGNPASIDMTDRAKGSDVSTDMGTFSASCDGWTLNEGKNGDDHASRSTRLCRNSPNWALLLHSLLHSLGVQE